MEVHNRAHVEICLDVRMSLGAKEIGGLTGARLTGLTRTAAARMVHDHSPRLISFNKDGDALRR